MLKARVRDDKIIEILQNLHEVKDQVAFRLLDEAETLRQEPVERGKSRRN